MALSKQPNIKDLLQCGICLMVIKEPKALPCLHSYCLKCLTKWAEDMKEGTVQCPLCHQDFRFHQMESKDSSPTLSSIHSKPVRRSWRDCRQKISKCRVHVAEKRTLKRKLIALIVSGKVDINGVIRQPQEYCDIHEEQKAEFHCKTCDTLVCDGCTSIDHLDHEFVGLDIAIEEHRSELKRLMTDCGKVSEAVTQSLENVEIVQDTLCRNVERAQSDLRRAADKVRARVLADIQQKEDKMLAKIMKAANECSTEIEAVRDSLQLDQTRFQTALKMAEVTHSGPDHNFTLFFSTLKNSMIQLITDTDVEDVDEDLGVIKFTECKSLSTLPKCLGTVSIRSTDEESVAPHPLATDERNFFPWE
ncbi:E3 ubiquitin-protein ligase TRIM50-like [Amphiura filiformis]|uniref:E3 ubiquitin-protein ligase TRIM50-like n=1 Tax=Amphiura filiformis TaxID=82378 RepID=UPI003B21F2B4